ncbi:MAG: C39 family peptidase [Ruminococcus sp.]|jgi:uncharacterized protein YvpB|nr:C39 family peptidase [Ruminococcus sp.]
MELKLISIVLGIFTLLSSAATGFAEKTEAETVRQQIAVMSDVPERQFDGYTIKEYIKSYEGYKKPAVRGGKGGKTLLDVPLINQYPDLPVGCEIASAVAITEYNGNKISLTDYTDRFITYDENFYHDADGTLRGPDPAEVFVGDPYGWGYGCYPPVLAKFMNKAFSALGEDFTAHAVTGLSEDELTTLVNGGVPVMVWASLDMEAFDYSEPSVWKVLETDRDLTWYKGSHTLVLCGADDKSFYFMDPNDKTEITAYSRDLFMRRYSEAGARAIIVKR